MNLTDTMTLRENYLKDQIRVLQEELDKLPEGEIRAYTCGKYVQWYVITYVHGHRIRSNIPKSDVEFQKALVSRELKTCLIREYQKELTAIRKYLKVYDGLPSEKLEKLLRDPRKSELLVLPYSPLQIMKAMKQKSSKDFHPETLIYTGLNGEKVRSKGELLIQTQLIRHGINFVYEPLMEVNTTTMHPDFLVMQKKTGLFIPWEHMGMMDSAEYRKNAALKLQTYAEAGFLSGHNLILTFESEKLHLNMQHIENIIQEFFL